MRTPSRAPRSTGEAFSIRTVLPGVKGECVAVEVVLPAALREYAKGASRVQASGRSLEVLLADLDRKFPGIRQRILADTGLIREFVVVFVNGDQVMEGAPERVPIQDGDTVHIIPSVAGG